MRGGQGEAGVVDRERNKRKRETERQGLIIYHQTTLVSISQRPTSLCILSVEIKDVAPRLALKKNVDEAETNSERS